MRKAFLMIAVVLGPTGCAGVHPHIPFTNQHAQAGTPPTPFRRDAHRQYFDKLHHRYFYYDPVQKAYFWETGQPKG